MANLKEIRLRIASVSSNMKITQAMKMVSASKFRHASAAIVKMRPYSEALSEILAQVSASLDSYDVNSPYTVVRREEKKMLLVVVTSNKGLCGAFNANVVKFARHLLAEQFAGKSVDIVTIGTKGRDLLARYCPIVADYSHIFDDLTFAASAEISQKMMDDFAAGTYDRVQIVYNRFKNAATQILTSEEFLPLVLETGGKESNTDFILEPDSKSIVEGLLPQSLRLQFFRILRDSVASEHGARMTAMSQATDNAKALKELLTLQYNNARQASITNQIIEIVSAAEALSGK
mgnify:CR=1 FL=1